MIDRHAEQVLGDTADFNIVKYLLAVARQIELVVEEKECLTISEVIVTNPVSMITQHFRALLYRMSRSDRCYVHTPARLGPAPEFAQCCKDIFLD